ncbi:ankyrin repeat domain-containing protein [Mycolicibacterium fluoranthenivorans]|uniref:Ankyrin repeat protein n=1 Tax=Mycolicibacterium fluoranthenivorans TaxID=258505 RepID=A0A7X5R4J0_9MYCO|nr:ankyrin repeat domain-containing protein [Mycolicibacterium fluoranthenivorans]MCV7355605.1 ankyrin repeat domain-containing protein [Mycolicibacterium fluoranthenivorans]NIH93175.1 ankyrin repeat protein [Mycolicibacterium fluoranthenivorans]
MARTPLHMYDMEYEIDEYLGLIASGEHDVNAQDADGKTPLHYAAEQGQSQIALALLDAGADPNLQEKIHGNSAFVQVVSYCDVPTIKKAIAHGADPTIANHHGVRPMDLAGRHPEEVIPLLDEAARAFLAKDGDTA